MTDLRLTMENAKRVIALRLIDETMQPDRANKLAEQICLDLQAEMSVPSLRGWRMIPRTSPHREQFYDDVRGIKSDLDNRAADELWKVVYSYGHNLPDDIIV